MTNCLQCNKTYEPASNTVGKFCSKLCYGKSRKYLTEEQKEAIRMDYKRTYDTCPDIAKRHNVTPSQVSNVVTKIFKEEFNRLSELF